MALKRNLARSISTAISEEITPGKNSVAFSPLSEKTKKSPTYLTTVRKTHTDCCLLHLLSPLLLFFSAPLLLLCAPFEIKSFQFQFHAFAIFIFHTHLFSLARN